MVLVRIHLTHFRNYHKEEITFHPGTNILYGKNGQGKTNVLESLYYLALTKSFRTNNDPNLILHNQDFFRIKGEFTTDQGSPSVSSIAFSLSQGKRLNYNSQKIQKFSDYIGNVPVVLLAPADLEISQSGPMRRRQFLDIMLSQASKVYLHHLLQYRRALKQRNLLLQQGDTQKDVLQAWQEALLQHGIVLIEKRLQVVQELDSMVKSFYGEMSGEGDKIKIIYQGSFPMKDTGNLATNYRKAIEAHADRDLQLQTTGIGPHRDDLLFLINGKPLRWVGSQGEHKTFIVALKMAEYQYLQNTRENMPLLLFDDIFGELDAVRITNLIGSLSRLGQVFITTTSPNFFGKLEQWKGDIYFYEIINGQVSAREMV